MPTKIDALGYDLLYDYQEKRSEQMLKGERQTWFADSDDIEKLSDIPDIFDTEVLNNEWKELSSGATAAERDNNKIVGARNKIAWVAACRRDLRKQFLAGDDNHNRVDLDHNRFEISRLKWAIKGMKRMYDLFKLRDEPIIG